MSYSAMRRKRFTAGVLAGAMALTVTPILGFTGTAGALESATGDGSVCEDAPNAEPFTDVSDTDPSQAEIECLVNTGITTGVTATTYEPNSPVTRRQMALFLVRLADVIEDNAVAGAITPLPAGDGVTAFTDIQDEAAEIQAAIDRLADSDIAQGVTPTEFKPAANVTRRQMAKFVVRLQEFMAGEDSTPANPDDAFTDDDGDSGEAELNILAEEGIFLGDGAGNVNPGDDISRRQMANVITREAQYLFEQGDITRLFAEDDGNQAFAVTPSEKATNQVSSGPTNSSGARQYSVSGLDNAKTYDIELHEAEDVVVTTGTVTFANSTPLAAGDTSIEVVNGASVGTADGGAATETYEVHNVGPVNGVITFTIDSVVADRVIPVLNEDTDADNTLDLATGTAPTAPTEPFGIGGEKEWIPAEAASGAPTLDETITRASTADDFFSTGTSGTFFYDSNDTFQIATAGTSGAGQEASTCVQVNMETFEQNLSTGDEIDLSSNYNADPAFASTLCIEDLTPGSPSGVAATASGNDVTVTWAAPASGADSYNIYRGTDVGNDGCTETIPDTENSSYTLVGSSTTLSFTEADVADGNYCYAVTSVLDGDESTLGAGADDEDDVDTPVADVTAPSTLANGAVVDVDSSFDNVADSGDVLKLFFTEPVNVAANAAIQITDAGADVGTITNGGNSTWSVVGNTVTITLNAEVQEAVSLDQLNWPATISNRSGVTDNAGNAWNIGAGDVTLEDDGPEFITDTATTGSTTFTITFNEALTTASAETEANYSYDPDGAGAAPAEVPTNATLGADGRTVTLTVTTAAAAGATVDPAATLVDTEGQGSGQGATAVN